jgi:hypothetical protein
VLLLRGGTQLELYDSRAVERAKNSATTSVPIRLPGSHLSVRHASPVVSAADSAAGVHRAPEQRRHDRISSASLFRIRLSASGLGFDLPPGVAADGQVIVRTSPRSE